MISTELSAGHSTGLDSTDAIPDGGDDGRQEDQQQVHDDTADSSSITTIDPTIKQWMVHTSKGDYQGL